ncbi:MAG: hypothetical protein AB7G87_01670 [Clostridia bacterium]
MIPTFEYDIEDWIPNRGNLRVISYDNNKSLMYYFGNWDNIKGALPSLVETIKEMVSKKKVLVADMNSYMKSLIDKGIYRFSIDKNGEIVPTIRNSKGIIKQIRLKEITLTPELSQTLNNLNCCH